MKKISLLCSLLAASGLSVAATTDDSSSSDLQTQVTALQKQVDQMSQQTQSAPQTSADSDNSSDVMRGPSGGYWPNVSIAPYIGIPSHYDGSALIINNPYVNDDVKLIQLRQNERAATKNGSTDQPHLIFTGMLEATATYNKDYEGTSTSDFDLTDAELDSFIEINHWVSGYMTFLYNNSPDSAISANRINNSSLSVNQGFIVIGDFDTAPYYMSMGQQYAPFGSYSAFTYSDPFTKTLGRVKAREITAGYRNQDQGFSPYMAGFVYQSATDVSGSDSNIRDGGANIGANFDSQDWSGNFGVSWISQLADSQGLQGGGDVLGFAEEDSYETMEHSVPGADINMNVSRGGWTLISEYVQSTNHFANSDMQFNGAGAQPKAVDVELGYSFDSWRPSTLAVGYDKSWQALAIDLPEYSYRAVYSVSVWKHTLLTFEADYNEGYPTGSSATLAGQTADTGQLGENYKTVLLSLDTYF